MEVQIGEHFEEQMRLTPEEIAAFARLCGDFNPLHHDEAYARQTRFGGIIASGPHVTSRMMGLVATHFSKKGAMLGLEFDFHFHKAVKAGEAITIVWEVVQTEPKASLQGILVALEGRVRDDAGRVLIKAAGKILLTDTL